MEEAICLNFSKAIQSVPKVKKGNGLVPFDLLWEAWSLRSGLSFCRVSVAACHSRIEHERYWNVFKLQGAKTAWDFPEICDFTVNYYSGIGDVHFLTHEVASSLGQSPPWSCHRSQAKACIAKATVKWSCAMLRVGQIERTRSPSMPLMLNTLNLLQKCVWIYINSNGKLHKPKCTAKFKRKATNDTARSCLWYFEVHPTMGPRYLH